MYSLKLQGKLLHDIQLDRRSLYGRYLLSRRLYRSDVIYLHVAYSNIIYYT